MDLANIDLSFSLESAFSLETREMSHTHENNGQIGTLHIVNWKIQSIGNILYCCARTMAQVIELMVI